MADEAIGAQGEAATRTDEPPRGHEPPQPPPVAPREPGDWSTVKGIRDVVEITRDGSGHAWRTYTCDGPERGPFTEPIWPAYVPTPASESAAGQGQNKVDDGTTASSSAVTSADKYWAEATSQARSTAKWIATSLGAALAAIIGTAPLTPLGSKNVDWWSAQGLAIVAGIGMLGVTFFMVVSVLVPGMTFFADLKSSPKPRRNKDRWWADRLVVSSAQRALARRAAKESGVTLPICITSLDELGWRVRLEEVTLDKVAEKIAGAPEGDAGKGERDFWSPVKTGRGKILQGYIDEVTQWVILASYMAVKVRADRARTIGLALGLTGAVSLVWGYIAIQPANAEPSADTATYVVLTIDPDSSARTALGADCDAFTGVALRDALTGMLAVYVTGGEGCTIGRAELPAGEVATVETPSVTPSPTKLETPSANATSSP